MILESLAGTGLPAFDGHRIMGSDLTSRASGLLGDDRADVVAANTSRCRTRQLATSLLEPPGPDVSDDEHRQRLLMTLDMVVASFESLIGALSEDERSTNSTLAFLDEAYEASAKYRVA